MNKKEIISYNSTEYPFKNYFNEHLSKIGVENLDKLHEEISSEFLAKDVVTVNNDQDLKIYSYLYAIDPAFDLESKKQSGEFIDCFKKFVNYLSKEFFNEKLVYQSKPTLRVHYPNNLAVGEFHRDSDYNHPLEEINIWVPMTDANNTASIWLESDYDKKDYKPSNMKYGQCLIFDSSLMHGNKKNEENYTRISFDFRVIPYSKWTEKNHNKSSVDKNLKFSIGGYYSLTD